MSTTQGTPALGASAPIDTRPAPTRPAPFTPVPQWRKQLRWKGLPVPDIADFTPGKDYIHVLTDDSPHIDAATFDGLPVRTLCGLSWVPELTDWGTGSTGPGAEWCPMCAEIHLARRARSRGER